MPCGSCIVSRTASCSTGTSRPATAITCAPRTSRARPRRSRPRRGAPASRHRGPARRRRELRPRAARVEQRRHLRERPHGGGHDDARERRVALERERLEPGVRPASHAATSSSSPSTSRSSSAARSITTTAVGCRCWGSDPAIPLGERSGRRDRDDLAEQELHRRRARGGRRRPTSSASSRRCGRRPPCPPRRRAPSSSTSSS